ncbi:hypothetical protein ONA92_26590 [Mycobacteroides salmoniphilum]|uniref:hypothetical protein n=1 Tax=Mycobacteroides salmoniphilum TaxID=404941 RepID=UPI0035666A8E
MTSPIVNTPGCGDFLSGLRGDVNKSLDAIYELGGLSRADQTRLEKGEPITVTPERAKRSAEALHAADPDRYPVEVTSSYIQAVATVHMAAIQAGRADRSADIAQRAASWPGRDRDFFLGRDLADLDHLVGGRGLLSAASALPGSGTGERRPHWDAVALDRGKQFADLMIRIAARQTAAAVTCPASSPIADLAEDYWQENNIGAVRRRADLRLDPLAGPMSISAARRRARALGAERYNELSLTMIIFVANALAASRHGSSPTFEWQTIRYDSQARNAARSHRFSEVYEMAKSKMPPEYSGQFMPLDNMLEQAEPILSKFIAPRDETLWDMQIHIGPGRELSMTVDSPDNQGPFTPQRSDLLIYSQPPTGAVRDLVADMGVPTIEMRVTSIGTSGGLSEDDVYYWCPVAGVPDEFAVLYRESRKEWIPVQLF